MGARWLANLNGFEGTIAPAGEALLAHAAYRPGERVVDVGFGGGATSLAIARAVSPGGDVVGIDISPDLVSATTRRAAVDGLGNVRFVCADAATVTLPGAPFDRLCSRFGSMFFAEPVAAFTNLRRLLRPGGRIDLAVWGPPLQNPWMLEGMAVARRHIELPSPAARARSLRVRGAPTTWRTRSTLRVFATSRSLQPRANCRSASSGATARQAQNSRS